MEGLIMTSEHHGTRQQHHFSNHIKHMQISLEKPQRVEMGKPRERQNKIKKEKKKRLNRTNRIEIVFALGPLRTSKRAYGVNIVKWFV